MMKRFFLVVFIILFGFSCKNENLNNETMVEMNRPLGISIDSQWFGGVDGGEWFLLSKTKYKNRFRIRNFLKNGTKHWDAVFKVNQDHFNTEIPYKFVFISNYTKCTIIQRNRKYIFSFMKDF